MKKLFLTIIIACGVVAFLITLRGDTADGYYKIVEKMGYSDVEKTPFEVVKFTVPENWGDVYERYNGLLEQNGYSLRDYKGKECLRYTYLIPSINARANIIVYDGAVIGGDVSGITLDGVMIPIIKE